MLPVLSAWLPQATPLLGISIQPGGMNLVACSRRAGRWRIDLSLAQPLVPGCVEEGRILQFEVLAQALRDLVQASGGGRRIALAMPVQALQRHRLEPPAGLRPWGWHRWVTDQAQALAQAPADALAMELDCLTDGCWLTACPRESVEDWQGLAEAAGLDLVLLDDPDRVAALAVRCLDWRAAVPEASLPDAWPSGAPSGELPGPWGMGAGDPLAAASGPNDAEAQNSEAHTSEAHTSDAGGAGAAWPTPWPTAPAAPACPSPVVPPPGDARAFAVAHVREGMCLLHAWVPGRRSAHEMRSWRWPAGDPLPQGLPPWFASGGWLVGDDRGHDLWVTPLQASLGGHWQVPASLPGPVWREGLAAPSTDAGLLVALGLALRAWHP